MQQSDPYEIRRHDNELLVLLRRVWATKLYWVIGGVVGAVMAIIFMAVTIPHYKASMLISPANPINGAEISSMLADENIFALRYLVQRVGMTNSSDFLQFENTFSGVKVSEALMQSSNIIKGMRAHRASNFSTEQDINTPQELSEYLQKHIKIEPVGTSTVRRLAYAHPDPVFAAFLLQSLHHITDRSIRDKVRSESEARIKYLQASILSTSNPEHRRALTTLLLEQERLKMLASIDQPYAAAIVEPASYSARPRWPNKPLVFTALILCGLIFGFAIGSVTISSARQEDL
jgi:uncharacterized protein involved in exopolysaccharide biosynthesis